ncbi:alpha/beta fold hydrolase [Nocardia carnea]|uniref:alpha/beta fold hydrolase n=1 Tax=Nocardia carnea TaxID=37328 RepID=UPI0024585BE5|nr:alpha/beta hydrolase [Nocardia carnea]
MSRGEVRTVRVGALDFEVRVHPGEPVRGADVLLLHGFPQSAASWDSVSERLSARGVRSYAPEQRGYSPGARPADVASYRLSELRADIVGLCDALGLRQVHLVGHDWGAIVAWDVAARYPDRVASLTALSVPHPAAFARARENDPAQAEKSEYMTFFQQPDAPEELLLANDCAGLRAGFGETVPVEQAAQHIARLREPGAMTAALNWYRASGDSWSSVPPVDVPTTFVWSDADQAVARSGVEATAEYVKAEYHLVVLEGVSHWIPEEAPDPLSRIILDRIGS